MNDVKGFRRFNDRTIALCLGLLVEQKFGPGAEKHRKLETFPRKSVDVNLKAARELRGISVSDTAVK